MLAMIPLNRSLPNAGKMLGNDALPGYPELSHELIERTFLGDQPALIDSIRRPPCVRFF
jgi:hypothetical protein